MICVSLVTKKELSKALIVTRETINVSYHGKYQNEELMVEE